MFKQAIFSAAVLAIASVATAQETFEGRLQHGDPQFQTTNEYFHTYSFHGNPGYTFEFRVVSYDFTPVIQLRDTKNSMFQKAQGFMSGSPREAKLTCTLPQGGPWEVVVYETYWEEGDYTFTITPVDASESLGECGKL